MRRRTLRRQRHRGELALVGMSRGRTRVATAGHRQILFVVAMVRMMETHILAGERVAEPDARRTSAVTDYQPSREICHEPVRNRPSPMLTVWEVRVGDEWRYATPAVASIVVLYRPGNTRLVSRTGATRPVWRREPRIQAREITANRLKASERRLKQELVQMPLLADQLPSVQPDARRRIELIDAGVMDDQRYRRSMLAKMWKDGRKLLMAMPWNVRCESVFRWNASGYPKDACNFLSYVRTCGGGDACS